MVTASTIALNQKGFFTVMASSAIFTGIQVVHGYLDGTPLHFGEHVRIVAIRTGQASFFVHASVKKHRAHRTALKLQRLARANSYCISACHKHQNQTACYHMHFHTILLFVLSDFWVNGF